MLELVGVKAGYGRRVVLHGVTLAIAPGDRVALVGHNGAGKSTIFKTITGELRPIAGTIRFDGDRIDRATPEALVRRGIVQVPAGRRVFPLLTVRQNLEAGAFTRRDRAAVRSDIDAVLDRFAALGRKAHLRAGVLSGGEQQMLAITRAMMARPRVLLVDEPSLGLSPIMVEEIFTLLASLAEQRVGIVLAEQNVRKALSVTDRAAVLSQGTVLSERPSAALLTDAAFRAAYFGTGA
jgi:branched-chain amino acid transport system ATP-binding protein